METVSEEEVELKVPKKLVEELARYMPPEVQFKTAHELVEEKKEKMNLENIRTLLHELRTALKQRDFITAKIVAKELQKELKEKKKLFRGADAPGLLYEAEEELGWTREITQDPSLAT